MLKKTITYKDLDGNDVTEDFYFNLSKAEIAEMELGERGGFSAYLNKIVSEEDTGEIIRTFKMIIANALGRRSEDGKRFLKSEEINDDFFQSDAYSQLFMELITDATAAAEFVKAIMPADMADMIDVADISSIEAGSEEAKDDIPAYIREDRDPTPKEMQAMSKEEMQAAFARRMVRNKAE